MGTNCVPLVADLFLFCYERDFILSLSDNNQADIIEAFNSTSRDLGDLLIICNHYYFEQMALHEKSNLSIYSNLVKMFRNTRINITLLTFA